MDNSGPSFDSTGPSTSPTVVRTPDHITLNVLSPCPEVPNNGRLSFPSINLDTTISALKQRIRDSIASRPSPEVQRLIYQGHALHNGEATLRQVLKPPQGPSAEAPMYTMHLVIPAGQPPAHPPRDPSQDNAIPGHPDRPMPGPALPTGLANVHDAQHMLQQQMDVIQQQLGGLAAGHHHHQSHANGAPQQGPPVAPGIITTPRILQAQLGQLQAMRFQAAIAHRDRDQPRNQVRATRSAAGTPAPEAPSPTTAASTSVEAQIHGPRDMRETVHESIGPHGEIIRTVIRGTMNVQLSRGNVPDQRESLTSAPADRSNTPRSSTQNTPTVSVPSLVSNVGYVPSSGVITHLPYPFVTRQPSPPTQLAPASAWILSSQSGPEALLFAPGHGYFVSPSRLRHHTAHPRNQQDTSTPSPIGLTSARDPGTTTTQPIPTLPATNNDAAAQVAVRAPEQPQPPGQVRPQAPNAADNDMFNLVVQRGWLFLRLYMFIFIFSEPGTWRRWLFLALATLVCMLPRDNPFMRAFGHVRRHVDQLIGPPQVQPAAARAAPAHPTAPAPAAGTGATATRPAGPNANPTPEETAVRLIREHEARNPSMLRDTFFRVERAVALFFASLVPGVGEQHIRAREEQRRVEREQEEQRRRDEEAAAAATVTAETEERKNETGQAQPPEGPSRSEEKAAVPNGEDVAGTS